MVDYSTIIPTSAVVFVLGLHHTALLLVRHESEHHTLIPGVIAKQNANTAVDTIS